MIFANVTDISIPQGNVIKIQETLGGRIPWQKYIIENGYPRMFIEQKSADDGNSYYTNTWNKDNLSMAHNGFALRESQWRVNDLIEFGAHPLTLKVNSTFTAYYVNNSQELNNYQTAAKKVSDAVWKIEPVRIVPAYANSSVNPYAPNIAYVELDSPFFTLSPAKGSSAKVTSVKNNFNEYLTFFESTDLGKTSPKVVPYYPNIQGYTKINVSSASLGISFNEIAMQFSAKR